MASSFNDIRAAVTDALAAEDKDKGDDLIVVDLGPDWVVFRDPDTDGSGLFRRSYKMDGDKAVLTGKPERVVRTYETVAEEKSETPPEDQPKSLKDAAGKAREAFTEKRKSANK